MFIYISGLPSNVNKNGSNITSANSSVSGVIDVNLFPPEPQHDTRSKWKLPPNAAPFPISCVLCLENSDEFIKADFESKTVTCKKCHSVFESSVYDENDFTRACLFDKKEASSSGYKKHSETAYLTVLADCKKADNEKALIQLREKELQVKTNEQERADAEKAARLELELKLEEKRFSWKYRLKQRQQCIRRQQVFLKKTTLEKYSKQKASIALMLAALTDKLNSDLLNSSLI